MARIKQKGKAGAAKNYTTRTQAIKKLQLSLSAFRKLCILKGIYPREPKNKKKANKGSTAPQTFYYTKDIQYLMHEPIINTLRETKTYAKKLSKAKAKHEKTKVRQIKQNRPVFHLEHIVKERYPQFDDALRDLDDALSLLFLFAQCAPHQQQHGGHWSVPAAKVEQCIKLCHEWQHYVQTTHSLQSVFLSVKGIYYKARVHNIDIVWLTPYPFYTKIPEDIDFRIIATFLDFYLTFGQNINLKLWSEAGLQYPPAYDDDLNFTEIKTVAKSATTIDDDDEEEGEEAEADQGDNEEVAADSEVSSKPNLLFRGLQFFLSRETPLSSLSFVIYSFGGIIVEQDETIPSITHQIVDRPELTERVPGRVYVQPQWVYDSINDGVLQPTAEYLPGVICPPHLSPFDTTNVRIGDEERAELEAEIEAQTQGDDDEEEQIDEDSGDEGEEAEAEIQTEMRGEKAIPSVKTKKAKKSGTKTAEQEKDEETERRKLLMSNKKRKLYERMIHGNKLKDEESKEYKRQALKKKKAQNATK